MTADSSAGVLVRRLVREDLRALLGLYAHLHDHDDPAPVAKVDQVWDAILEDSDQIYLGAFSGGTLVSACNATVIPNLTRGARPYAVIENVVTHADHRRLGVGSRVIKALIEECRQRQCYKVMLMSASSRVQIHGFYESLGFDKKSKQAFVISMK